MAVPRNRGSNRRKKMKRSHNALAVQTTTLCAHCGVSKRPHHLCGSCGQYRGRSYKAESESEE